MKSFPLLSALLLLLGCSQQPQKPDASPSIPDEPVQEVGEVHPAEPPQEQPTEGEWVRKPIEDLEGAWVLNKAWLGFMGVAIQFKQDGTFKYWFYSDVVVPNGPSYPITGIWSWSGPVLELKSEHRLHDTRWYVYWHRGAPALLPEYARRWQLQDGKPHDDRLLFRIPDFDESHPFAKRR